MSEFSNKEKGIEVYRSMLILVGAGNVGKTTLVKRLKLNVSGKMKVDARIMTDGIDISEIKLVISEINGHLELRIYDFAGQEEYYHTHALFVRKDSIFIVLHKYDDSNSKEAKLMKDELDNFLKMIASFALGSRVIFCLTHCEDVKNKDTKTWFDKLINDHKRLEFIKQSNGKPFEIDSVEWTNIELFKSIIVSEALKYEKTRVTIPSTFLRLKNSLDKLIQFSISQETFHELASKYVRDDMITFARDIFKAWGIIYILSNGDIVLKPQKLADVLACVFTKTLNSNKKAQSYLWGGYIKHNEKVLNAIWGKKGFQKDLWLPFIDLLHETGLSYPIFDEEGRSLHASRIPSLLPKTPLNLNLYKSMKDEEMIQSIFGAEMKFTTTHSGIALTFHPNLPITFVGQLQSRLCSITLKGGAWRYGCSLQSKDSKSCAIFYVSTDNEDVMYCISGGTYKDKTEARDKVLIAIYDLIRDKYDSLVCSVDQKSDSVSTESVNRNSDSTAPKFRFTDYLANEPSNVGIRNIIDKYGRNLDCMFNSEKSASYESFSSSNNIQQLQAHMNDTTASISNYLWDAVPDLLEITIGQPLYSDYPKRLIGLWLIFKDPNKSNQFHAIHFYYYDSDDENLCNWHSDSEYLDRSTNLLMYSIPFESSSTEINIHKNSNDIIKLMRHIFHDIHKVNLPTLLDTNTTTMFNSNDKNDDPWSLLVCMKLENEIIREKLHDHEARYYTLRPKINNRVNRYDRTSIYK